MTSTLTLVVADGAKETQLRFDVANTGSSRAVANALKAKVGPLAGGREATLRLPVLLPFDGRGPVGRHVVVSKTTKHDGDKTTVQPLTATPLRLAALPTGRGSDHALFVIAEAGAHEATFSQVPLSKASLANNNLSVILRYLAGQNEQLNVKIARAAPVEASRKRKGARLSAVVSA